MTKRSYQGSKLQHIYDCIVVVLLMLVVFVALGFSICVTLSLIDEPITMWKCLLVPIVFMLVTGVTTSVFLMVSILVFACIGDCIKRLYER